MRRLAEISLFLTIAAGLHVAAFGLASGPEGGAGGGGGDRGTAPVTLAAAPPALSRLAEDWQAAPAAQTEARRAPVPPAAEAPGAPMPDAPAGRTAPPLAPPPAVAQPPTDGPALAALAESEGPARPAALPRPDAPARPGSAPRAPAAPQPDLAPPTADAPPLRASPRPAPRPEGEAAPDPTPQAAPPPAAAQRAEGAGRATAAGESARPAPAVSPSAIRALRAEWGGEILARVSRLHRYPRGVGATGRALVELVVARDGRLVSARLARSAGDPALDSAALAAVRRAGPFPPAPGGLREAQYRFTLPLKFDGRG